MKICNNILFIILVVVFCCNCEQAVRNLVSSFQISETSIDLFDSENLELSGWNQARESTIYSFKVCLEDKFQSHVIRHQKFQVHTLSGREIPLSGNGFSDVNGCLKWTEEFPSENNAANDYYIYCERIIKPLGTHYGVQKWSWAIDVHPEGNFYDSHEVGDFYPWLNRKNQKHNNVINCDSDVHQDNAVLFAVSNSYEEAFGRSGNPLLLSSTSILSPRIYWEDIGFSPFALKYELAMNLNYKVRSTESIEEQREIFTGKYRIRANLIAVLKMGDATQGKWNQCVYLTEIDNEGVVESFQKSKGEGASNELRVNVPIYWRFVPPGSTDLDNFYLQLEVEPIDKPENVHLTRGSKWFGIGNINPEEQLIEHLALSALKPSTPPSCAENILEIDLTSDRHSEVKKKLRPIRPFEIRTKLEQGKQNLEQDYIVHIEKRDLDEESNDISLQEFQVLICVNLDSRFNNKSNSTLFDRARVSVERILDQRGLLSLQDDASFNASSVPSFHSQEGLSQRLSRSTHESGDLELKTHSCVSFKDEIRSKYYDLRSPYLTLMYKVTLLDAPGYSDILFLRVPADQLENKDIIPNVGWFDDRSSGFEGYETFQKIIKYIDNTEEDETGIRTIFLDEPVSLSCFIEDHSLEIGEKKNEHVVDNFLNLHLQHSSQISLKPMIKFGFANSDSESSKLPLRRGFYFLKFVLGKEITEVFEPDSDKREHIISYDEISYLDDGGAFAIPFEMTLSDYKLNFTYNNLQAQLLLINEKKMILAYYMAQLLGLIETSSGDPLADPLLNLKDLPTGDSRYLSEGNFDTFDEFLRSLTGNEIKLPTDEKLGILSEFLKGLSGFYTLENEVEDLKASGSNLIGPNETVEGFVNNFIDSFLRDYDRCSYESYKHLTQCDGRNQLTKKLFLQNILGYRDSERIYFDIDNFRRVKKYLEEFLGENSIFDYLNKINFHYSDKTTQESISLFLVELIKKSYGFLSLPLGGTQNNGKTYGNLKKIREKMSVLFKLNPEMKKWIYANSSLKSPVFQFKVRLTPMQWVYKVFGATQGNLQGDLQARSEFTRQLIGKREEGPLEVPWKQSDEKTRIEESLKYLLEGGKSLDTGVRDTGVSDEMDLLFQKADQLKYERKLSMCYAMLKPFSFFGMKYASFDYRNEHVEEDFPPEQQHFPISSWCYKEIKNSLGDYLVSYLIQSISSEGLDTANTVLPYREECGELNSSSDIDIDVSMIQDVREQAFELLKILKLNNISVGCILSGMDDEDSKRLAAQNGLRAISIDDLRGLMDLMSSIDSLKLDEQLRAQEAIQFEIKQIKNINNYLGALQSSIRSLELEKPEGQPKTSEIEHDLTALQNSISSLKSKGQPKIIEIKDDLTALSSSISSLKLEEQPRAQVEDILSQIGGIAAKLEALQSPIDLLELKAQTQVQEDEDILSQIRKIKDGVASLRDILSQIRKIRDGVASLRGVINSLIVQLKRHDDILFKIGEIVETVKNDMSEFKVSFNAAFDKAFRDVFLVNLQQEFNKSVEKNNIYTMISTFKPETLFGHHRYDITLDAESEGRNEFKIAKAEPRFDALEGWVYDTINEETSPARKICQYLSQNVSFETGWGVRIQEAEIKEDCINGFKALRENRIFRYSNIQNASDKKFSLLKNSPFLILSEYRVFKAELVKQMSMDSRIFYISHSWATENARTISLDSSTRSSALTSSLSLSGLWKLFKIMGQTIGIRGGVEQSLSLSRQDALSSSFYLNRKETDETRFSNLVSKLKFELIFKEYEKCLRFIKNPDYTQEKIGSGYKEVGESVIPTYQPPMGGISKKIKEMEQLKGTGGLVICGLRKKADDLKMEESYFYVNNAYFRNDLDVVDYTKVTSRPRTVLLRGEELIELFNIDLVRNNHLNDHYENNSEEELTAIEGTYRTLKENYFLLSLPGVYSTLTQHSLKREGIERWLSWKMVEAVLRFQDSDSPTGAYLNKVKEFMAWSELVEPE